MGKTKQNWERFSKFCDWSIFRSNYFIKPFPNFWFKSWNFNKLFKTLINLAFRRFYIVFFLFLFLTVTPPKIFQIYSKFHIIETGEI